MNLARSSLSVSTVALALALGACGSGSDTTPAPLPGASSSISPPRTPAGTSSASSTSAEPQALPELRVPAQRAGDLARTTYRDGGVTAASLSAGSTGQVLLSVACASRATGARMTYLVLERADVPDGSGQGNQADQGEVSCDGTEADTTFEVPRGHYLTVTLTGTSGVDRAYAIARNS